MFTAENPQVQIDFDKLYITAAEIRKRLGISRAGFLYGRRVGKLPEHIVVNEGRLFVWKRDAKTESMLGQWKLAIDARKVKSA